MAASACRTHLSCCGCFHLKLFGNGGMCDFMGAIFCGIFAGAQNAQRRQSLLQQCGIDGTSSSLENVQNLPLNRPCEVAAMTTVSAAAVGPDVENMESSIIEGIQAIVIDRPLIGSYSCREYLSSQYQLIQPQPLSVTTNSEGRFRASVHAPIESEDDWFRAFEQVVSCHSFPARDHN